MKGLIRTMGISRMQDSEHGAQAASSVKCLRLTLLFGAALILDCVARPETGHGWRFELIFEICSIVGS